MIIKIKAGAGCGKTTFLKSKVQQIIEHTNDASVLAATYMRSFAAELHKLKSMNKSIIAGTYHSIAYHFALLEGYKLCEDSVQVARFCKDAGLPFSISAKEVGYEFINERCLPLGNLFDKYRLIYMNCEDLEFTLQGAPLVITQLFEKILKAWNVWKEQNKYADFLDCFKIASDYVKSFSFDLVVLDESQDLTYTIYKYFVGNLLKRTKEAYIAYDPAQNILNFLGSHNYYVNKIAHHRVITLNKTYRLTSKHVRELNNFAKLLKETDTVFLKSKNNESGETIVVRDLNTAFEFVSGNVAILTRTNKLKVKMIETCLKAGYLVNDLSQKHLSYYDYLETIIAMKIKHGMELDKNEIKFLSSIGVNYVDNKLIRLEKKKVFEKLGKWGKIAFQSKNYKNKQINVGTIHDAKGLEFDTVILPLEMGVVAFKNRFADAELRVWYVALSRMRKRKILLITNSKTNFVELLKLHKLT